MLDRGERFPACGRCCSNNVPRTRRKPRRAAEFGIDTDLYEQLLASQDGHCALCPTRPKTRRLHVDHDHRTGAVRGLLCYACNRMLTTKATRDWLLRAAEYVGG